MFVRCIAMPLVFAFPTLFAKNAQAFFDPPWVMPENPVAGEAISVGVRGGICDILLGRDGYPQITREGNAIRIAIFGAHYEPGDELCVFPPVWTGTRSIGVFPRGDYTLTVDLVYEDQFTGRPEILNIGVVLFRVNTPPALVSVPVFNPIGAATLIVALTSCVWMLCKRRRLRASLPKHGLCTSE
ncbi:hypothetical protein [Dokdonella ginsengisoli]|uniref:IPTL-CTERM protein sorting domain-containing protein n=1 Tax=Dokdonella ginsengisoli TaxID=363846 RepID=A0ABV9QWR8_9GAMM